MALKLDVKLASYFIDRPEIARAIDKARKRNLVRFAAFIRTAARGSIKRARKIKRRKNETARDFAKRKRNQVSQPGRPPIAHTKGAGSIKNIQFGYDPATQTVVVGAVKLDGKSDPPAPGVLEKGGPAVVRVAGKAAAGRRRKRRKVRVQIAPRPYMAPAFEKEAPKFPDVWKDSIGP